MAKTFLEKVLKIFPKILLENITQGMRRFSQLIYSTTKKKNIDAENKRACQKLSENYLEKFMGESLDDIVEVFLEECLTKFSMEIMEESLGKFLKISVTNEYYTEFSDRNCGGINRGMNLWRIV